MEDPDAPRIVYGPSALTREKGLCSMTSFWGGYYKFSCGLTDHIDLQVDTVLPIMVLGFAVLPKFALRVHEKVRIALQLHGGFFWLYMFNIWFDETALGFIYGASPLLVTFGDERCSFTIAAHLDGVTVLEGGGPEKRDFSADTYFTIIPAMGGSFRISDMLRFHFEAGTFLAHPGLSGQENGKSWMIMYGLKIIRATFFSEIDFVIPLIIGRWETIKYCPIGYPVVVVGGVI